MKLSIFAPLLFLILSCNNVNSQEENNEGITISGTVGYPQTGLVVLEKFSGNRPIPYDTINIKEDYTFSERVIIDEPGYFRLNFYNKQSVPLILDEDDIQVTVDGNAQNGFSSVSGSRDHDIIQQINEMVREFQSSEEINQINQEFGQAHQQGDEATMDELREKYVELNDKNLEKIIAKIDSAGAVIGITELLRNGKILDKDKHFDVYQRYADRLAAEKQNSPLAVSFIEEVEQMKMLSIGKVAPEIALPNPDGEIVKLSSLRGKYVLVDFWAKWCKPCRMENPNVVRMYNKYNDQGFEVYGVSLDRNREQWLQAIEEDGLHWTQVSDLKYWQSEAAKIYNIKAIPFAVLLDPNGVIIGKNLRGKELENKLAEIFDNEG